jgi:hypothetical protein
MNAMHWIGLYTVFVFGTVHSLAHYFFENDEEEMPVWQIWLTRLSAYVIALISFLPLVYRKANHKQEPFT